MAHEKLPKYNTQLDTDGQEMKWRTKKNGIKTRDFSEG
jgi:hypothetical protein